MTRVRIVALVFVALVTGALCARLGVWQLERLAERRDANERIAASLAGPPVDVAGIRPDSTSGGRRVVIRGTYDFAHEVVLVNRSRDGAPGVNLLTPLRLAGRDTAVLVNRGWVYSPDGGSVDRASWREPAQASGTAYVLWPTVTPGVTPTTAPMDSTRRLLRADPARIAAAVPYPVAPYQLVLLGDSTESAVVYGAAPAGDAATPARLPPPPLDEGPHKGYAVQWFSFAAIALAGTGALLWTERTRARLRRNGRPARVAGVR